MPKILRKRTGLLVSLLVLGILVSVIYAGIAPSNQTYRAAAKHFLVYGFSGSGKTIVPIFTAPYPGYVSRIGIVAVTGITPADTVTNTHTFYFISKGTTGTGADTLAYYVSLHDTAAHTNFGAYQAKILTCDSSKNYMSASEEIVAKYDSISAPTVLGATYYWIEFIPAGGFAPKGMPTGYKGTDQ